MLVVVMLFCVGVYGEFCGMLVIWVVFESKGFDKCIVLVFELVYGMNLVIVI